MNSEIAHAHNATYDSKMASYVVELAKASSQRYKLSAIVQAEMNHHYLKIMARSCPSFVVGHLKKKKKKMEVWLISVYMSSDVSELVCECCWV